MKSVYLKKQDCSGCSVCKSECPVQAITMSADEEGFSYPRISQELCFDCEKCVSICPLKKEGHYKSTQESRFYAMRHKSEDVLKKSTSGGAFTALSDCILAAKGVVYGAVFDENLRVIHSRAHTPEQRDLMRISKYVQSNIEDIYDLILNDIASGKEVLFTGTPCQIAGIRAKFEHSPHIDKLYLCDIICHSIPSPRVWEDYKALLEEEAGGKLVHVQFRSKNYSWSRDNSNKGFSYQIEGENSIREDDRFYHLFIKGNCIVRPSCYHCRFTDTKRSSDITIADYWGIELFAPKWYNPLGISLVLANTPQGQRLLNMSADYVVLEERPSHEAVSQQKRLSVSSETPAFRKEFWEYYTDNGLCAAFSFLEKYIWTTK